MAWDHCHGWIWLLLCCADLVPARRLSTGPPGLCGPHLRGPAGRGAEALAHSTSSARGVRRGALAFPTTRCRALLQSLRGSAALQRGPALLARLEFLRRRLPTHDVPAWRSPDGNGHGKMLRHLETLMAYFLVRHRWGWGDPHGRDFVVHEQRELLTEHRVFCAVHPGCMRKPHCFINRQRFELPTKMLVCFVMTMCF